MCTTQCFSFDLVKEEILPNLDAKLLVDGPENTFFWFAFFIQKSFLFLFQQKTQKEKKNAGTKGLKNNERKKAGKKKKQLLFFLLEPIIEIMH